MVTERMTRDPEDPLVKELAGRERELEMARSAVKRFKLKHGALYAGMPDIIVELSGILGEKTEPPRLRHPHWVVTQARRGEAS